MRTRSAIPALAALATSLVAGTASAQDFIDQVRFGGTWANPQFIDERHAEADQGAIQGEILFRELGTSYSRALEPGLWKSFLSPRIHLGALANFADDGTDYAYAGLTWHYDLGSRVFVETSFGLALNNGSMDGKPGRVALGSDITFRESLGLGINLTEQIDAIVVIEHLSHAELFDDNNRGLTNLGVRLGYKF